MTIEAPSWSETLGDEGPKPYASAAWVALVSEEVEEEGEEEVAPWWESLTTAPKPYETAAWTFTQVSEVIEGGEQEEEEALFCEENSEPEVVWLSSVCLDPKPYETANWTALVSTTEEEVETPTQEWWETVGGAGPKPYNYAAWTFTTTETVVREFVALSERLFFIFDETYFDRTSLGLVLDSGYFGQKEPNVYDEAYFNGSERGVLMTRTLSRMMIYDSKASSPGKLSQIIQPLGLLCADPAPGGGYTLISEPVTIPATEIATDVSGSAGPELNTDAPVGDPVEITCDGQYADATIEATRLSNPGDDCPPGTLLGTLSYELFEGVITITDWDHYNWEDDTPVLKAVQTLLSRLPSTVTEVRVQDDPTPFWVSLGFKSDFKGDPYVHLRVS